MAIDMYPNDPASAPRPARSNFPVKQPALIPEPDCCQVNDRCQSLVLTQANGTTEGFPLTWLYRWRWEETAGRETLILTLTEHEVVVKGKRLERILEALEHQHGVHLRIKDDRYHSLNPGRIHISTITVQTLTPATRQDD
jgi:hypothetical protein